MCPTIIPKPPTKKSGDSFLKIRLETTVQIMIINDTNNIDFTTKVALLTKTRETTKSAMHAKMVSTIASSKRPIGRIDNSGKTMQ